MHKNKDFNLKMCDKSKYNKKPFKMSNIFILKLNGLILIFKAGQLNLFKKLKVNK